MIAQLHVGAVGLVVGLAGCRARVPTYYGDVAPILARHCRECHRPGGVAPVPTLADYASAKMYAPAIKLDVQARRMPPWGVDNTGLCGSWQGARWLSGDEIATIARWQEGGAPAGKPTPEPAPPVDATPFRADAALDIGGVYKPGLGAGGNRCFVADPRLDRDRLLTAIRVVAEDARAIAQVTLFALDSTAAEAEARAFDAGDAGLGYACYASARVRDARLVASWTWPAPVLRLPDGVGVRLHGARKVVVQIHYDIAMPGASFASGTRVELELDEGVREAEVVPVAVTGASLPPARRYVAVEAVQPIARHMRIVGIVPRMHGRGDVMHLVVERGGESTCLATFDHWHANAQQLFRAARPVVVEPRDRIRISCAYGTLGRNTAIAFGDDINDEECAAYLFVTD